MRITSQRGPDIPKEFIGIFIEDINYAVDGGLYAELLENRNFECLDVSGGRYDFYAREDGLFAWGCDAPVVRMEVVQGSPVSEQNPHYLRVSCAEAGGKLWNRAYSGVCLRAGQAYRVSFYARCVQYQGTLGVAVIKDGAVLLSRRIDLRPAGEDGWNRWERYEATLCSDTEIMGGQFAVLFRRPGIIEFDWFSMVPEDAMLGLFRRDLTEALKALRPGFLRFPGGCVTEGNTLANRFQFKKTLGRPEDRRYNWNRWAVEGNTEAGRTHGPFAHYGQTYGIGAYEYFLLCEYLGAKPLPVLGVGLACQFQSHERVEPEDQEIRAYLQDYLDLIEFANGGPETRWGAVRCRMGHPEPFGLEMIGVGNEQWETPSSRFFDRYTLFVREIRRVYPDIRLIGTAGPELDSPRFLAAQEFYGAHRDEEGFVYAVDEHFYTKPEWFLDHCDYFDHVPRQPKVFFGEYAAHTEWAGTEKVPQRNTLYAALSEAAFLTGMARNSDAVAMTCYAPLLARMGYAQWSPNLIWFDERTLCRTPSYYVQQMFSENLGDCNVRVDGAEVPCQASYSARREELVLMLVNATGEARELSLDFDEAWQIRHSPARQILLAGSGPAGFNLPGDEAIRPVSKEIPLYGVYCLPPYSFAVLGIPAVKSGGKSASGTDTGSNMDKT